MCHCPLLLPPPDYEVHTTFEGVEGAAAATVHDKANVGKLVRYYLRFDDGVVSAWCCRAGGRAGSVCKGARCLRRCSLAYAPSFCAVLSSSAPCALPASPRDGRHCPTVSRPPLPCRQDIDIAVSRRVDEQQYDMEVGAGPFLLLPIAASVLPTGAQPTLLRVSPFSPYHSLVTL